jgi:hypothetical protein
VLGVAVFLAGGGEIALFHGRPMLLTALLVVTAALVVGLRFRFRGRVIALYGLGALLGPAGEMVAMTTGTWHYADPAFLGIPIWLPFGWGLAVVVIGWIAGALEEAEKGEDGSGSR